jgi:VWFA-related protein
MEAMMKILVVTTCVIILIFQIAFAEVEEKVNVGIIEVWVKVTDKQGKPVKDLQQDDFRVRVDDQELPLRCFDTTFDENIASEKSHRNRDRKFIFFFYLLNTLPGDMDFLKNNTRFIADSFTDQDQGMVFTLLPSIHLGVTQKMTSNKQALIAVIRKMRGNLGLSASIQNNEKQLLDLLYPFDTTAASNPLADRGVGQRPMETLREAQALVRNLAAQEESRCRLTLNSFTSIAQYLSGFPLEGPVVLLYVSGGFPTVPGEQYYQMVQQVIEERFVVGSGDLALMEHPQIDLRNDIRKTVGGLNRMNVTIYSLDAKGLLMTSQGAERDTLQAIRGFKMLDRNQQLQDSLIFIARETGGIAFTNSQNYMHGLAEITRDMNEQYLLCAALPSEQSRGGYHEIKVHVSRPGLNVRHRKGYVD